MLAKYKKNIFSIILSLLAIGIFVILLNIFFDIPSLKNLLSQTVIVRTSLFILVAFILTNFLFVINLLQASHIQHQAVLENISEGLVVVGKNKQITIINTAAQEMLKISSAEAVGKKWEEVAQIESHQEPVSIAQQPLFGSLSEQKIYSKEWQIRNTKGEIFPAAISTSPVVARKKVTGEIIVFRNIEKEQEIDTAKSEFISLVSHQLRTPLSAINWCSESLLIGDRGKLNNKQKDYIIRISESNRRMITLVNSILDVSQIELNTFVVDAQPTDLYRLVEDIVKESSYLIKEKQLILHKNYNKKLGSVNIDQRYLRMIIGNLLSNAIKYTPDKGKISVSINIQDDTLEIQITDTGYGIPKADTSKIFTKLFRAHNIITKDTDGNGLGLYIVKSIVGYAGGKIWFESEEGVGTTFFVTLPII